MSSLNSSREQEERRNRSRSPTSSSSQRKYKKKKDRKHHHTSSKDTADPSGLGKRFVWKKKIRQDRERGLISQEERDRADQQRREETRHELENLRKRRELREIERQQRETEMTRLRRAQEQESLGDWERREEEFHLNQAKRRAEIRIRAGRPKPVDLLAMNLKLLDEKEEEDGKGLKLEVDEPHTIVERLKLAECEELIEDVEMYLGMEVDGRNREFWKNLLVVCRAHCQQLKGKRSLDSQVVDDEVRELLDGKRLEELEQLESDVQSKLSGKGRAVDIDYWEKVRRELVVAKARATLSSMHAEILERRWQRMQKKGKDAEGSVEQQKRKRLEELQRRIMEQQSADALIGSENKAADNESIAREMLMMEAEVRKRGDGDDDNEDEDYDPNSEAIFSVEAAVPTKTYSWQDKHRPRKPRYYNRVHTGYEWNKYNQTHYDKDNPPPKVVQGYKFNIFYPDLIDKLVAPTYRVEKDNEDSSGEADTVVLRFIAGPPYEDVAFRIVNREWEYNRRRGFKNTFDRGVLQLHFRFKRHHYRR